MSWGDSSASSRSGSESAWVRGLRVKRRLSGPSLPASDGEHLIRHFRAYLSPFRATVFTGAEEDIRARRGAFDDQSHGVGGFIRIIVGR